MNHFCFKPFHNQSICYGKDHPTLQTYRFFFIAVCPKINDHSGDAFRVSCYKAVANEKANNEIFVHVLCTSVAHQLCDVHCCFKRNVSKFFGGVVKARPSPASDMLLRTKCSDVCEQD